MKLTYTSAIQYNHKRMHQVAVLVLYMLQVISLERVIVQSKTKMFHALCFKQALHNTQIYNNYSFAAIIIK